MLHSLRLLSCAYYNATAYQVSFAGISVIGWLWKVVMLEQYFSAQVSLECYW